MKILEVVPVFSDPFGGPVSVVRSISKELAKKHEITVYTTTALDCRHDFDAHKEVFDGYSVFFFKRALKQICYSDIFGQLNISPDLMNAIRLNIKDFDIVHVHSWHQFPDIIVSDFAKKNNIPYVLQAHGSVPLIGKRIRKLLFEIFFGRKIIENSSAFIALSQMEVCQYSSIGIPLDKIKIIPNGIDASKYPNLPSKGQFRKKLGLSDMDKIVLYVGRIHETKGLGLLVKAFNYLIKHLGSPNTYLIIAGPNDGYLDTVNSLVSNYGLEKSVFIFGFLTENEKMSAFKDADVFATPCFYGFPVTFLEACLNGTPIVTTSLGDSLDWINGSVGIVTKPTEVSLAQGLYEIATNSHLRKDFSEKCVELAMGQFSIEQVCSRLEKVYCSVVQDRNA